MKVCRAPATWATSGRKPCGASEAIAKLWYYGQRLKRGILGLIASMDECEWASPGVVRDGRASVGVDTMASQGTAGFRQEAESS